MNIVVNGNNTDIDDGCVISDLIKVIRLNSERIAVELNKKIVRRADWGSTLSPKVTKLKSYTSSVAERCDGFAESDPNHSLTEISKIEQ